MLPARDHFHWEFLAALEKDGWTITDDPLLLHWEGVNLFADLGAERKISGEDEVERAAFELKSLNEESGVDDVRDALGQYRSYRAILKRKSPTAMLYLALSETAFQRWCATGFGRILREDYPMSLVTLDPTAEEIRQWLK